MADECKHKPNYHELRVGVVGHVDAGKSTLVGVLSKGDLDDGRGKARKHVFVHKHELESGRTSAIAHQLMGFTSEGQVVHQASANTASSESKQREWTEVVDSSQRIVTLVDLAGHQHHLRTTLTGVSGGHLDLALLVVNALDEVPQKMTKEHMGAMLGLEIPFAIVLNRIDQDPGRKLANEPSSSSSSSSEQKASVGDANSIVIKGSRTETTRKNLEKLLKSSEVRKLPYAIRQASDLERCIDKQTLRQMCPIFSVSCVTGEGLSLLYQWLSKVQARTPTTVQSQEAQAAEFSIDEWYHITGLGLVASGNLEQGSVTKGQTLWLGPYAGKRQTTWIPVRVRSIHHKRKDVSVLQAPFSGSFQLVACSQNDQWQFSRKRVGRGMVLLGSPDLGQMVRTFEAEVTLFHHPTTIQEGFSCTLHCGPVAVTVQLKHVEKYGRSVDNEDAHVLRSRERGKVIFSVLHHRGIWIRPHSKFVFREATCRGYGRVLYTFED